MNKKNIFSRIPKPTKRRDKKKDNTNGIQHPKIKKMKQHLVWKSRMKAST